MKTEELRGQTGTVSHDSPLITCVRAALTGHMGPAMSSTTGGWKMVMGSEVPSPRPLPREAALGAAEGAERSAGHAPKGTAVGEGRSRATGFPCPPGCGQVGKITGRRASGAVFHQSPQARLSLLQQNVLGLRETGLRAP